MSRPAVFLLLCVSALSAACASNPPVAGASRLASGERSQLAQTISSASMQVYQCDKVDGQETREVKVGALEPLMQRLMRPEGSVTERWETSLCGRKVEHTVFHGVDTGGRRAIFIGACDGNADARSLHVMRFETAGNALSNWMAAGLTKVAGAGPGGGESAKGLALLMACRPQS